MSLSRAFTTRRNAKVSEAAPDMPKRSLTTKHSYGTIRHKISAPVELISTTNMLSYNAPDIYPRAVSSSSSSSGEDSDIMSANSPDTSSIESSSPTSPKPNHLSCYFGGPSSGDEAPSIPRRALTHTKKRSQILAHQKSLSGMSSPAVSRQASTSTARSSINLFSRNVDTIERQLEQHPFGPELAQVSEIAEEFGISKERLAIADEEEKELVSKGLFKFRAEDYMSDIHGLFMSAFCDPKPNISAMWI